MAIDVIDKNQRKKSGVSAEYDTIFLSVHEQ